MSLTLPDDRAWVIAEAGTNHAAKDYETRFRRALDYVGAAAEARANAVKFQFFDIAQELFCPLEGDEYRWGRWDDSVLRLGDWRRIKQFAEGKHLVFLASTFQHSTVKWLTELGVVATKVASRAAKTFPYKDAPKPYLVSLGMAQQQSVECPKDTMFLQCQSEYPSTMRWASELPTNEMEEGWEPAEGFSDHSGTPWRAIDAISRGCRLVEVHYHLDERDAGPDLPASLTLDELKLVCAARDAFVELRKQ